MSKERTRVQRILAACDRGRGKRYPSSVRREVVRYAQCRRDEGASWYAIADELGLCDETPRRWCSAAAAKSGGSKIAPVEVVASERDTGVVIVSPSGFRLEGLDVSSAVAALKALQ
jgi:hypothetical protein